MYEEILPGSIWKINVPLPGNPLKATNAYYILGEERNLIIDTGMRRKECFEALNRAIKMLNIDLARTDFFITHFHSDHIGLVNDLATPQSTVYFNEIEADLLANFKEFWEEMFRIAVQYGYEENEIRSAVDKLSNSRYRPDRYPIFTIVREGSRINVGSHTLQCLETPGHSPGHVCLFDPEKKILFSGDHVLKNISPVILGWDGHRSLQNYLESLDKVNSLEVDLVFPGHGSIIDDCKKTINELKEHHRCRAEEILSILQKGCMDTFAIASRMSWRINESWANFPDNQKWLATGEAIAHLNYLEDKGKVYRVTKGSKIFFCI